MKRLAGAILVLLMLVPAVGSSRAADTFTVKLATLAWDGSPWHKRLQEMGDEWQQKTEGRVRLNIYPGGVAGDDPVLVRKIRVGQLHAGALTVGGLGEIDPAFSLFAVPMFFDSFEEFTYVLEKMTPVLKERLDEKGFVLLHWGYGGWVHIFSKRPVRTVDDLKGLKMFTWAGDDSLVQVWKSNGFRPVALESTDILVGLQTGMIEGMPTPPLAALISQWFRQTPYMLSPGVTPLVGATVVSKRAWNQISERDQAVILEAARAAESRLAVEIPQKDLESIEAMKKRGLTVIDVSSGQQAEAWRATAESFASGVRSSIVPAEIFELALKYRTEFRSENSR